ncbi:MAG: esterase [Acidobacteria bacterium]|nr:esterase [Acidobacteriota bacterium]
MPRSENGSDQPAHLPDRRWKEVEGLELGGRLLQRPRFRSKFLGQVRDLWVYLPPGYDDDESIRYPTLYLSDGQNLFDSRIAFGGRSWTVGETVDALVWAGTIRPPIIIGIGHAGKFRADEYTPTRDAKHGVGGGGGLYGRQVADEIKPRIDEWFRTDPSREATGIGGSSLGGLIALYIGAHWPGVFGRVLAMSPSIWWDKRHILKLIRRLPIDPRPRIWIDSGGREARGQLPDVRRLRKLLESKGWTEGVDLRHVEDPSARHEEPAWGARLPDALAFLYPPESRTSDIPSPVEEVPEAKVW